VAFHPNGVRWTVGSRGAVSRSGRVRFGDGTIVDGVIVHPDIAGRTLRDAPDFPGTFRMQVGLALPAQRTLFRVLEVPSVKDSQLSELVMREIRREMPMLNDNAYVSWKRIADVPGGAARVFVVGTARDIMDSHVAAAKAAGLQPQTADLRIVSAARAIGEPDCVVANVEEDEAELAIFRDGLPVIVRHVTLGSIGGVGEWSRQLAEELTRTLKFYRDTHRDDALADELPISFVGDAARQAMLAPEIAEVTGRAVEMPALRLMVFPEADTIGFAANVGIALKDIAA
jgi:Tfp pilus assembly PilM family ATPase